jgi:hypothetical protein
MTNIFEAPWSRPYAKEGYGNPRVSKIHTIAFDA